VWATILIVVMFSSTTGLSQSVSPDLLKQLPCRHIGPDGNRAIAVVGEPGNPAVTYVGERLQWFGPAARYGIVGSGKLRLAAAAEYRIGTYEETDSDVLTGLGDREDTLLGGLGLQYEISEGFELELLYQHDVLDRIGGGTANVRLSRGIPWGPAIFVPQVAYNWLSSEMSNHDYGVPQSAATVNRPAYRLGSTTSLEAGLGVFVELSEEWRIIVNVAGERLDDDVSASPIIDDDIVIKGLAIVSYIF